MGTFIKLFIVGVLVVVFFKVLGAVLPYVLLGLLAVYLINKIKKNNKNDVVVHKE